MIFVAAAAFAQTGPEGHWDGAIKLPDREMPFALDLAKNTNGDWIGSFGVPAQKLTGVEISRIQAAELSSPGESHPEALPELYVSVSNHTAPLLLGCHLTQSCRAFSFPAHYHSFWLQQREVVWNLL